MAESKFTCVNVNVKSIFGDVDVKQNNPLICADTTINDPFGDISFRQSAVNFIEFADGYGVGDSSFLTMGLSLEDVVISTDSLSLSYEKAFEDVVNAVDVFSMAVEYNREFAEYVYQTDQLTLYLVKEDEEVVVTSDELQPFVMTKAVEETVTPTESLSFSAAMVFEDFANPVDLIAVPDGSTYTFVKTVSNTVAGISDTIAVDYFEREADYVRSFTDTVTAIDELQPFSLENSLVGESTTTADDEAKHFEKAIFTVLRGDLEYMFELGDLMLGSASYDLENNYGTGYYDLETWTATQDVSAIIDEMTIAPTKVLSDSVTVEDAIIDTSQDYVSGQVESASTLDASAFTLARTFVDATSGFTETTDIVPTLNKAETVVLSEDIQQFSIAKQLEDSAQAIDLVSIPDGSTYTLNKTATGDVYSATDVATLLLIWNRNLLDTAYAADEIQSFDVIKILQDTAVATETLSFDSTKSLSDSVTELDAIALDVSRPTADALATSDDDVIDFGKSLGDTQNVYENIESFAITKLLQETEVVAEELAIDLVKAPINDSTNGIEDSIINLAKAVFDTSLAGDSLETLDFIKSLSDTSSGVDSIQTFGVTKLIQDSVNAIDLIGVNDGITYDFGDSEADSIATPTDVIDILLVWNRYYADFASGTDAIQTFDVTKLLEDTAVATEDTVFDTTKVLAEIATPVEAIALDFARPLDDSAGISDDDTLGVGKLLTEIAVTSEAIQSFDVEKPLTETQAVTEEKVYSLIKPFADATGTIIDAIRLVGKTLKDEAFQYERQYLNTGKYVEDTINTADAITAAVVTKLLSDSVSAIDLIGVSDGITYDFGDTEADSIATPTDVISILVATQRIFSDISLVSESSTFDITKLLEELAVVSEDLALNLARPIDDTVSAAEAIALDTDKALSDSSVVSEDITDFSFGKTLTDVVSNVEDQIFVTGKGLTEAIAPSEELAVDFVMGTLTEAVASVDAVALDAEKTFNEIVTIGTDVSIFDFGKVAQETVAASEFIQSFNVAKELTDSVKPEDLLGITDGITYSFGDTETDTFGATDFVSFVFGSSREFAETLIGSDAITEFDFVKTLSDTGVITEDATVDVQKVLTDTASVADSIAFGWYKDYTETATASDTRVNGFTKSLADSLTCKLADILIAGDLATGSDYFDMQTMTCGPYDLMGDIDQAAIVDEVIWQISKSFADSVNVSDIFDYAYDGEQEQSELASAADAMAVAYAKPFEDSYTTTDVYSPVFTKNIADSVSPFDTLIEARLSYRTVENSDSVNAEDTLAIDGSTYEIGKAFAETLDAPVDSFSFVIAALRTFAETVGATEDITTFDISKSITDTGVVTESLAMAFATARADTYSVSDADVWNFNKALADETNNGDEVAITVDTLESLDATLAKSDSVTTSENVVFGVGAQLNDAASTLENADLAIAKVLSDIVTTSDGIDVVPESGIGDSQLAADAIQSFGATKLLSDSVSAIDLIGITDGITYSFDDTESDTFGATDTFAKSFTAVRSFSDSVLVFDAIQGYRYDNPYDDALVMSDENTFDVGKDIEDSSVILEAYAASLAKPTSDTYTASDSIRLSAVYFMTFSDPLLSDLSYELNEGDLSNEYPSDPGRVYDLENYDCHVYDLATAPIEKPAICDAVYLEPNKGLVDEPVATDAAVITAQFNREFADTYDTQNVTDAIYFSYVGRVLSDVYNGTTDAISLSPTISLADTVSEFEDSISLLVSAYREINDTVNAEDILSIDGSTYVMFKAAGNEIASPSDSASLIVDYNRSFTDYVTGITDVIIPSLAAVEGAADTFSMTELATFDSTKLLTDSAVSVEALALDVARPLDDTVSNFQDAAIIAPTKALADVYSGSIDNLESFDVNKVLIDIATPTEALAFDVSTILNDSAATQDSAAYAFAKTLTDSISNITDEILFERQDVYGDLQSASEAIQKFGVTKLLEDTATAVDLIGVSDGVTYDFGDTESDFVAAPTDVFSKQVSYDRSFADSVLMLDTIQGFTWDNPYDDALVMSDNDTLDIGKGIADSSTILESYVASMEKATSDTLSATDVLTYSRVVVMSLADPLLSDLSYELNEGDLSNEYPSDPGRVYDLENYDCHVYDLAEAGPFEISALCDYISIEPNKGLTDQPTTTDDITLSVEFVREFADTYDTQNVTDTIYFSYVGRVLADVYSGTTDAVSLSPAVSLASEYTGAVDSATLLLAAYREFADSVVGEDTLAIDGSTYAINKITRETYTAVDSFSSTVNYNRTFSDLVTGITDILVPSLQAVEGLGDTFGTSETQVFGSTKLLSDTVSEVDAIALSLGTAAADTFGAFDSSVYSTGKSLSDAPSGFDLIQSFTVDKALTDTQSASDSIDTLGFAKSLADVYSGAQDASIVEFNKTLTDSASVDDSILVTPTSGIGDAQTASEAIQSFNSTKLLTDSVNAIDLVGISDGITYGFDDTEADTFTVADTLTIQGNFARTFTDSVLILDSIQGFVWDNPYDDALVMSDANTLDMGKAIEDSSAVLDAYAASMQKSASETFTATDSIAISSVFRMSLADPLYSDLSYELNEGDLSNNSPSDPGRVYDLENYDCHVYDLSTAPMEESAICDAIFLEPNKGLTDELLTSDNITLSVGFIREFGETQGAVDTIYFSYVNKTLADVYSGATDAAALDIAPAFGDTLSGTTDSVTLLTAVSRTFNDSATAEDLLALDGSTYVMSKPGNEEVLSTADVFTKTTQYSRTFSDLVTGITDVITPSLLAVESYGDTSSALETLVGSFDKVLSDIVSIADASSYDLSAPTLESVGQTDAEIISLNKGLYDAISSADTLESFDVSKSLTELMTVSETTSFDISTIDSDTQSVAEQSIIAFAKTLSDSISNITDSILVEPVAGVGDIQSASEAIQSFNATKLLSDSVSAIDLVGVSDGITYGFGDTEADTFGATDVFAKQIDYSRAFSDSVLILDDIQGFIWDNPYDDALVMSDNDVLDVSKNITDSSAILEAYAASVSKPASDDYTATDTFALSFVSYRTFSDIQLTSDSLDTLDVIKGLSDQATTSDNTTLVADYNREFADTYDTQNVQDALYFSYYHKSLADVYNGLTDSASLDVGASLSDVYSGAIDSVSLLIAAYREVNDSVTAEDQLAIDGSTYTFAKFTTETLSAADNFSKSTDYIRSFTDLVTGITDVISSSLQAVESPADSLTMLESTSFDYSKLRSDAASTLDADVLGLTKPTSETIGTSDVLTYTRAIVMSLADPLLSDLSYELNEGDLSNNNPTDPGRTFDLMNYDCHDYDLMDSPIEISAVCAEITMMEMTKSFAETVTVSEELNVNANTDREFTLESASAADTIGIDAAKTLADIYSGATDSSVNELSKVTSDTPVTSDSVESFDITKQLSDSVTPLDLLGVTDGITYAFGDTETDTFGATDALTATVEFARTFAEISTSSEEIQSFGIDKVLSDVATASESVSFDAAAVLTDSYSATENTALTTSKLTSDVQSATEYAIRSTDKVLSDAVSNIVDQVLLASKVLSDTASTTEATSFVIDTIRADSLNALSDDISFAVSTSAADVYSGATDELTNIDTTKGLAESYTGAGDAVQSFEVTKALADFANAVDMIGVPDGSTYTFDKTLANVVNAITDNIEYAVSFIRNFSDSVTAAESARLDFVNGDPYVETFSASDTLALLSVFTREFNETMAAADASTLDIAKTFTTDYANPVESVDFGIEKPAAETLSLSEDKTFDVAKLAGDTALISEATAFDFIMSTREDSYSAADNVAWEFAQTFTETGTISESIDSFVMTKAFADEALSEDLVNVPDGSTYIIAKSVTEASITTSDSLTTNFAATREFAETVSGFSDILSFDATNALQDIVSAPSDETVFSVEVVRNDYAWATESNVVSFAKALEDTLATPSDTISLLKAYIRDISESATASEEITSKEVGTTYADTYTVGDSPSVSAIKSGDDTADEAFASDSGNLIMQDYVDITYFAEDYIGETRSW